MVSTSSQKSFVFHSVQAWMVCPVNSEQWTIHFDWINHREMNECISTKISRLNNKSVDNIISDRLIDFLFTFQQTFDFKWRSQFLMNSFDFCASFHSEYTYICPNNAKRHIWCRIENWTFKYVMHNAQCRHKVPWPFIYWKMANENKRQNLKNQIIIRWAIDKIGKSMVSSRLENALNHVNFLFSKKLYSWLDY